MIDFKIDVSKIIIENNKRLFLICPKKYINGKRK